jgi:hypothetical protein
LGQHHLVTPAIPELDQFNGKLIDGLRFCSKVYKLFESIRRSAGGISRMRRRPTRLEKKLLEELLPICRYVQASYRIGRYMSIRWVDGNQQYDAEVHQRGAYVSKHYYPAKAHLEVTCVMHPNEYLVRELLDTKGHAFSLDGVRRLKNREIESTPRAYSNREFVEQYAELATKRLIAKSEKPYPPNTTLIVECTLNLPYTEDEWADLMVRIGPSVSASPFPEIYLYDTLSQHSLLAKGAGEPGPEHLSGR